MATDKKTTATATTTTLVFDRENVKAELGEDGILTIRINTTADMGMSASGKSRLVATTRGNKVLAGSDGLVLAINAYRPIGQAVKA